jgi:hypothetical protein
MQPNGPGRVNKQVDVAEMDAVRYWSRWMSDRYFMEGVASQLSPAIFFIAAVQER